MIWFILGFIAASILLLPGWVTYRKRASYADQLRADLRNEIDGSMRMMTMLHHAEGQRDRALVEAESAKFESLALATDVKALNEEVEKLKSVLTKRSRS